MKRTMKRAMNRALGAAIFFYSLGLVFHAIPFTRALAAPTAPVLLIVFGILVSAPFLKSGGAALRLWAAITFIITFALEAIGVATGLVFGPYEYGTALGPNILAVPPVIGFNWVLVVLAAWHLARIAIGAGDLIAGRAGRIAVALLTGLFCALFDWVMEPAAIALGYWNWFGAPIPLQNYIAWFIIAALAAWSLETVLAARAPSGAGTNGDARSPAPSLDPNLVAAGGTIMIYAGIQLAFFIGIRIELALGLLS